MYITQRSMSLLEALYANYTGKSFFKTLAGIDAEIAAMIAQKDAEIDAEIATMIAQKDAEIDAEKINVILQLHKELGLSAEKISSVLNYDLAFVQNTIAEHFKK